MDFASMRLNLAATRGEHPVVLSFRSRRRRHSGMFTGDSYARMATTHSRALSMGTPHTDGFGMGLESLGFGQRDHGPGDLLETVTRELLYRECFYKVLHAESATVAGRATGGQCVIGTSRIVTCRLRRIVANENRTSVADQRQIVLINRDMFGRNTIGPFHGLCA